MMKEMGCCYMLTIFFIYYISNIFILYTILFIYFTLHEWIFPVNIKTHFSFQFLSLASSILNFITTSMLKSRNNFIRNYLSVSLTEQHMATLASIIKDVDKDAKGQMFLFFILNSGHTFRLPFRLFLTCNLFLSRFLWWRVCLSPLSL